MSRSVEVVLTAALLMVLAGCGGSSGTSSSSGASAGGGTSSSGSATSAVPAVSKYDAGPRAGEGTIDEAKASEGEGLFKTKGCSACHTFGKKMSGPDLRGVSMRRTAQWMENQILHPEVMTKEDPISKKLLGEMMLQMPNQGLTSDQARAVIEYLKHQDHEAGLTTAGESHTH